MPPPRKQNTTPYLFVGGVDPFGNIPEGVGAAWMPAAARDVRTGGPRGGNGDVRGGGPRGRRRDVRIGGPKGGNTDVRIGGPRGASRGMRLAVNIDDEDPGGAGWDPDEILHETKTAADGKKGGKRSGREYSANAKARDGDNAEPTTGSAKRRNVTEAHGDKPAGNDQDDASGEAASGRSWGSLYGAGHVPDLPDPRDAGALDDFLKLLKRDATLDPKELAAKKAQPRTEKIMGPVSHQGPVQSATAQAVVSLAEYAIGRPEEQLSVLFLYKLAREMGGLTGDRGISFRQALRALSRYGCVLEEEWPHEPDWVEVAPEIRDLQAAAPRRGLKYACLDAWDGSGKDTLKRVLEVLDTGRPVGFGMPVYRCIDEIDSKGCIPLPEANRGGGLLASQAVVAVGYEFAARPRDKTKQRDGYLIVRNSWGPDWGEKGYARLPLEYVTKRLARDFWVVYGAMEGGDDLRP